MKNWKSLTIACLALLGVASINAQDIHFSQFYLSPLNLNPAMTGVSNCNTRLTANYRNQWASVLRSNAFSTYSVSYDQRIPVGRYDYFGVGGTFWGDTAGEADFSTLTGKLSAAYSKQMSGGKGKSSYLVVGAEAGVAQRSIDFLDLRWGNQHDGEGGFDPTRESGEQFDRDNFLFADLAAGVLLFMIDGDNSFYAGGAFHHLNRANQSFSEDGEDLLYSRLTAHLGGEFMVGKSFGLVPGVIMMNQGPSFQVNAGMAMKFLLKGSSRTDRQAFQTGLWWRVANKLDSGILNDAAILTTRFDFNNFTLGFSYDINISELRTASNSNGGFEFALVYKICGPENRGLYCPDF